MLKGPISNNMPEVKHRVDVSPAVRDGSVHDGGMLIQPENGSYATCAHMLRSTVSTHSTGVAPIGMYGCGKKRFAPRPRSFSSGCERLFRSSALSLN